MQLPRLLFRLLLTVVSGLGVASVSAQRMVVPDPRTDPVTIETADVHTEVTGRLAVTTFDLVFRNPNGRVLEGTFEFPLLAGQTVVRFALDVGGHLREAVPVDKDRGRVVFEEIERRRVDPGLLEQTAGNNYRARIYPIPARGTRRVVIAYQEDVARAGQAGYRLPLDFADPLKRFRLTVVADTGAAEPPTARTTLGLTLPSWRNARILEIERNDFVARGVLELELPAAEHPQVLTQHFGDADYFYAEVPVPPLAQKPRPTPRVVGLLWDASGSGRERDHVREWALLEAWFAAVPNVSVKLILLRDHAAKPVTFTIRRGNWGELREALEHAVYDGGTSFDGLVDDATVDEWLLFSDGLVNFGLTQGLTRLPLRSPVHAIVASARADSARLRAFAQQSGGEAVDLISTPASAAVAALRSESLRVLGITRDPEQVAEIFPGRNAPVGGGVLVVSGRLNAPAATVKLRLGHDVSDTIAVELHVKRGENPSELAARAWAAAKIAELETDPVANREDIRRTSQTFGIVTANSSLIVLETLADYLRYDITPPAEFQAGWEQSRRQLNAQREKARDSHLEQVVAQFRERIRWWETEFPKDERRPATNDKDEVGLSGTALTNADLAMRASSPGVPPVGAAASAVTEETVELMPFAVAGRPSANSASTLAGTRLGVASTDGFSYAATSQLGRMRSDAAGLAKAQQGGASSTGTVASIGLQRWEPQAGYLDRLRRASSEERYEIYLEERGAHSRQPGFYLDAGSLFLEEKDPESGIRIWSNLAELQLEDAPLLRVLGHRLIEAGRPDLARPLFERALVLRPEEPQSGRDLALVCAAVKDYQRAVDLLWEVVSRTWDARFPEIELIALDELNAIVATCPTKLDLTRIDSRLRRNLPVGLRAVLTWDADACDIDLWVDDPNGERAIYNHPRTYQGGRMSRDFTGGYGPEEFLLRDPKPGRYTIRINYFGERRQTALGPVTAQVRLITGFGTPEQKEKRLTVRLSETKESLEIGTIEIGE